MSPRFRKSFRLFPGVRLNVSRGGMSATIGVKGASINVGKRGVRATVGIPGTGVSWTYSVSSGQRTGVNAAPTAVAIEEPGLEPQVWTPSDAAPRSTGPTPSLCGAYVPISGTREIASAAVDGLTSQSMSDFRAMIADARTQRSAVSQDLAAARARLSSQKAELDSRKSSLFRSFYKKTIARLEVETVSSVQEVGELEDWLAATHISVQFETSPAAQGAYAAMLRAFDSMAKCAFVWDITSDLIVDRAAARSSASRGVHRTAVQLDLSDNELLQFEGRALRFGNVNGDDLLVYPSIMLVPRVDGAFAILDLREINITASTMPFVEDETVPPDSTVIGQTWTKVNKDGSRDKRFADNRQIPICEYGKLTLQSSSGLNEEYQTSNAAAALAFGAAFSAYRDALGTVDGAGSASPS